MWVFWLIVGLNRKIKNKNPMKYDDVNEEGELDLFFPAGVAVTVSVAQVYRIEFW